MLRHEHESHKLKPALIVRRINCHSENCMLDVKCILSAIPSRLILFQDANGNCIALLNEIFDPAIEFRVEPAIENYI
jgi:hypothetical protein